MQLHVLVRVVEADQILTVVKRGCIWRLRVRRSAAAGAQISVIRRACGAVCVRFVCGSCVQGKIKGAAEALSNTTQDWQQRLAHFGAVESRARCGCCGEEEGKCGAGEKGRGGEVHPPALGPGKGDDRRTEKTTQRKGEEKHGGSCRLRGMPGGLHWDRARARI